MKCRIAPCCARPQQIVLSLLALDPQAIFATAVICRRRAQMGQLSMSLKVMEKHRERMRMQQNAILWVVPSQQRGIPSSMQVLL